MIDTKQLKHAAKAAGYEVVRIADDGKALMLYGLQEPWNPRTDNEQAFELALRAKITFHRIDPYVYAIGRTQHQARFDDADMMYAAREAVFMAAVELGKAMK